MIYLIPIIKPYICIQKMKNIPIIKNLYDQIKISSIMYNA